MKTCTTYKLLQNSHSEKTFHLITKRFLKSSIMPFAVKKELTHYIKPKEKISVIKSEIIPGNRKNILEWKSVSYVMKKFNYENKMLFGPAKKTKFSERIPEEIMYEESTIIQHETNIPIIDPVTQHQNIIEVKNSRICSSDQKEDDLNSILTFPLENKVIHSTDTVNSLNFLRKNLEYRSKETVPSVSLILQKTMPIEQARILDLWKQKMIKEMGEEGFQRYQRALLEKGSSLHNNISSFLASTPESELQIKEENIGHWKSVKDVLPHVKDVKLLEEFVTHPFLCYRGVVDCFAKYRDHLVVIDWKTSKKPKTHIKSVYDNPLQIAAYVGALNFDPKFQYLVSKGAIVVAYESGTPATVHFIDSSTMVGYWREWLKRVKKFWEMKDSETEKFIS